MEETIEKFTDALLLAGETCVLDWVEKHPRGGTLDEIGRALGLTRERVRQIEQSAVRKLREAAGYEAA